MQDARILIVDDEDFMIRTVKQALGKGGYANMLSTTDSRETVALFQQFQPDLILLDLNMPNLDGFAVLEQLRELIPPGICLPILVLTGECVAETRQRAFASGARDFLSKPFDYTELMVRIRNLLEIRFLQLELQRHKQQPLPEMTRARDRQPQDVPAPGN